MARKKVAPPVSTTETTESKTAPAPKKSKPKTASNVKSKTVSNLIKFDLSKVSNLKIFSQKELGKQINKFGKQPLEKRQNMSGYSVIWENLISKYYPYTNQELTEFAVDGEFFTEGTDKLKFTGWKIGKKLLPSFTLFSRLTSEQKKHICKEVNKIVKENLPTTAKKSTAKKPTPTPKKSTAKKPTPKKSTAKK